MSEHTCKHLSECDDVAFVNMCLYNVVNGVWDDRRYYFEPVYTPKGKVAVLRYFSHGHNKKFDCDLPKDCFAVMWQSPNFSESRPDYYITDNDRAVIDGIDAVLGPCCFFEMMNFWPAGKE